MKHFVDKNTKGIQELEFVFGWVENVVGKGENAGYQHFLLFPLFSRGLVLRVVKIWDCMEKHPVVCKCFKFGLVNNLILDKG